MRVILLAGAGGIYTSNAYLVLGDWSALEDVNTLVDVGRDPAVLESIEQAPTGVGKPKVEQVVLTHGHYDHTSLLPLVRETFHPKVLAAAHCVAGVDELVKGGDLLRMGDRTIEVIHTPGHTSDSICLYEPLDGVLFAGDTPLLIRTAGGTYEAGYVAALRHLCARDIRRIYFGHGEPLAGNCNARLRESLRVVEGSDILTASLAAAEETRPAHA